MRLDTTMDNKPRGLIDSLGVVFLRMVAIFLLAFALVYWARLTGTLPANPARFDTMPEHWRIASLVLAVILPVAAVGLWGLFPWGVVVWFAAVAIEVGMYAWRTDLFGTNMMILYFHAMTVTIFLIFKLIKLVQGRRAAVQR